MCANCGRLRVDRLEVAGVGERDQLRLWRRGRDVAPAHLVRDAVVRVAVDHDLAGAEREQLERRAVGEVLRRHEAGRCALGAAALGGVANVGDRGQRDDRQAAALRRPERELAAGGMADEHRAAVVGQGQSVAVGQRTFEVLRCRGPFAAGIAEPAVLEIPASDPGAAECLAEVTEVDQVVGRLPVAAVQHERERERPVAGRDAKVAELERLRPVGDPRVRRPRRRVGENVGAVPHRAADPNRRGLSPAVGRKGHGSWNEGVPIHPQIGSKVAPSDNPLRRCWTSATRTRCRRPVIPGPKLSPRPARSSPGQRAARARSRAC